MSVHLIPRSHIWTKEKQKGERREKVKGEEGTEHDRRREGQWNQEVERMGA